MRTQHKFFENKIVIGIVFIAVLCVYWVRLINLDQDLPAWGLAFYQPKDEGCYAVLAVNEWEYGTVAPKNPLDESSTMYIQEHIRTNLLGNLIGIWGFHTLGDNYYGLRVPMVILGFLNLITLGAVLLQLRKRYGKKTTLELWGIIGCLAVTSFHFYFYVSSRTVEPSTLRMLFVQLVVLVWLSFQQRQRLCFFLMGLLTTTSVFLVYITNVFLYLSIGLLLLLIWKTDGFRVFLRNTLWFAIGSLFLLMIAECYYRQVWGCSALGNFFGAIGLFSGVGGYQLTTGGSLFGFLRGVIKGGVKYFSSFVFLYAPALLMVTLALLPLFLYRALFKRDKVVFFLLAVPASFLLQTMVSEDYIWRKFLVVVPCYLYLLFLGILLCEEAAKLYQLWKCWCNNIKRKKLRTVLRCLPFIYFVGTLSFTLLMVLFHLSISDDLGKLDLSSIDKGLILLFGCVPLIILVGWVLWNHHRNQMVSTIKMVFLLVGSTAVLNLCLLGYHVWIHPTFEERDMMTSLSVEYGLDGQYVTGDYAMGITLYNDMKPVLISHTDYANFLIANPEAKLFLYAIDSMGMQDYIDHTIFSNISEYSGRQTEIIPGTFQAEGSVRNFALYEAALRKDICSESQTNFADKILAIQKEIRELEENTVHLSLEEVAARKAELKNQLAQYSSTYDDYYGDRLGDIYSPVYVDTYGNIYGDIYAPIYGRIFGDIYGNVYAPIYGDIYGDVYGAINSEVTGEIHGKVHG